MISVISHGSKAVPISAEIPAPSWSLRSVSPMGRKGFLALWEGQLKIVLSGFMGTSSVACGATFPSGARLFVSPRLQGYTRAEKPVGQGFLCRAFRLPLRDRRSRTAPPTYRRIADYHQKSRGNPRLFYLLFSLFFVYDSSACSGVICFFVCFLPIFTILRMVGLSTMLTSSSNTKLRPTKNTIM